uniref:Uncharacterized protein n=1 Tax=Romanomermis culicivorax TaxID=13658 RepID=A0A915L8R4_ROMCU
MLQSLNPDMDPVLTAAYDQREMPTINLAQEIVIRNIVKGVLPKFLEEGMDNDENFEQNSDYNEFLEFKRQKELQKQYQQMQHFQQQVALQPHQLTQAIKGPTQTLHQGQFPNQQPQKDYSSVMVAFQSKMNPLGHVDQRKFFERKIGKGTWNRQQALTREWLHTERHIEYRRPQHRQDNRFFFIEDCNVKRVVRVHELDQWFKETFGYWPANPKEPILVDLGRASQVLQYVRDVSIFRGHPVCGFYVEKVNQDKVATLFKTREVKNLMGNQFAQYISFVLTNGQTYVINTTGFMEKEWANCDRFAKRGILPEELRLAAKKQAKGTPMTGSENDAYDTVEEMRTHEATTT